MSKNDITLLTQMSNKPAYELNIRLMGSRRYLVCSSKGKLTQQPFLVSSRCEITGMQRREILIKKALFEVGKVHLKE